MISINNKTAMNSVRDPRFVTQVGSAITKQRFNEPQFSNGDIARNLFSALQPNSIKSFLLQIKGGKHGIVES
jgi:hypothetical protein